MKLIFIFAFISASYFVGAEVPKHVTKNNLVWFGYIGNAKLSSSWSIYFDFGLRRTSWLDKWSQVLFRAAAQHDLNKNVSMAAGAAYFLHYNTNYVRSEYRLWQQLNFSHTYGIVKINHRIRTEQRFNNNIASNKQTNSYTYTNRFRYQLSVKMPLFKNDISSNTSYINVADEVMINSGKSIVYNYFDQNRISFVVGYNFNKNLNVLLSFMHTFLQRNSANSFEANNIAVLNLYHTFGE